jgi:hypothetical protein
MRVVFMVSLRPSLGGHLKTGNRSPSSPGEFHPEALTEPCLTVSGHKARAIHGELPPPCRERSVPPVTG